MPTLGRNRIDPVDIGPGASPLDQLGYLMARDADSGQKSVVKSVEFHCMLG